MTRYHSFAFRGLGFFVFALGIALMMHRVADAASLRPSVRVDSGVITLADLVDGQLNKGGEQAVTRAPAPGQRKVVAVEAVAETARAHGAAVTNPSGLSRVVVERRGRRVPMSLIRTRLKEELSARDVRTPYEIDFAGRRIDLAVPPGADMKIRVERFDYNPDRQRFEAVLSAPVETGEAARQTVFGQVTPVIRVPMLASRMGAGEVIAESDIVWTKMPENRVSDNHITDSAALIGKSPRRPLSAEQPVRRRDIREPVIVEKGSTVTMMVKVPGLTLTATGRAMEDGSKGELIRVVNADTHQTVNTEVIGPSRVRAVVRSAAIAAR